MDEMLSGADLIVIVEVVRRGEHSTLMKAEKVLKGTAPTKPFTVMWYNNENWPREAIEKKVFARDPVRPEDVFEVSTFFWSDLARASASTFSRRRCQSSCAACFVTACFVTP